MITFNYTSNGYEVTGQVAPLETDIIIPSTFDDGINGEFSVTSIVDGAFSLNQLTSVVIPDSVTSIGYEAFSLNQLTSVDIPDSVTSIGDYAFYNNQLTSVDIPDSVTSIGAYAFYNNQLTSVVWETTAQIQSSTFGDTNNKITSFTITGNSLVSLSNIDAFDGVTAENPMTVYIQPQLIEDYKTATNWTILYNEGRATFEQAISQITKLKPYLTAIKEAIQFKDGSTGNVNVQDMPQMIRDIPSGSAPPIISTNLFTGATIPLNYYGNTNVKEYTQFYKSGSHNITITGLDSEATITGNGTKAVTVEFSTTSTTTHLTEFTITLEKDLKTITYKGLYAYYGTNVAGCLTLAYTNIPRTGTGTIGTEYKFIETTATDLPYFSSSTTLWNTIYSYQVLNTLVGNVTSIGSNFLSGCYSFNQPLDISNVTSISSNFLSGCYSFNQPPDLSNLTSIGNYFLNECYSFNQPPDLSNLTSIGDGFLTKCNSFNQPLDLSNVTSIGNYFLNECYSFNQPLDLSNVTSIGDGFLFYCISFNQPPDLSNLTSIGDGFLNYCYSFNQPLDISNVTSISSNFLSGCYSFNQPLDISNVTSISDYFLFYCYSFNQNTSIPSNLTSIGTNFMENCYSLSTITYNATVFPTDNNALAQDQNSKTSTNGAGILVFGTQRAGLLTALPNRTLIPRRKLIDGGS